MATAALSANGRSVVQVRSEEEAAAPLSASITLEEDRVNGRWDVEKAALRESILAQLKQQQLLAMPSLPIRRGVDVPEAGRRRPAPPKAISCLVDEKIEVKEDQVVNQRLPIPLLSILGEQPSVEKIRLMLSILGEHPSEGKMWLMLSILGEHPSEEKMWRMLSILGEHPSVGKMWLMLSILGEHPSKKKMWLMRSILGEHPSEEMMWLMLSILGEHPSEEKMWLMLFILGEHPSEEKMWLMGVLTEKLNANGWPMLQIKPEEVAAVLSASIHEKAFKEDHVVKPSSVGKASYGASSMPTKMEDLELLHKEGALVYRQGYYYIHEVNWIVTPFEGRKIVPCVSDQGSSGTCVFHALGGAANMEIARTRALQGMPSPERIDVPTFILKFEASEGASVENFKGNILEAAIQHLEKHGVPVEGGGDLIKIEASPRTGMSFPQVCDLLIEGRPVLAGFNVDSNLRNLKGMEIYECTSHVDHSGGGRPRGHMVLFVGYGIKFASQLPWPYLIFLNSWGEGFGEGGAGRVFFHQLRDFFTVTVQRS